MILGKELNMWLFDTPKNYIDMCKKISMSVFWFVLIELFVLSQASNDFATFMKVISFNTEIDIAGLKLYVAYVYIPLLISILENIFKLHDKFGKVLRIRKTFAAYVIFKEYIKRLEIETNFNCHKIAKTYLKNENLQHKVGNHFYHHVSDEQIVIDKHYVYMALGSWSWVWIILNNLIFTIFLVLTILVVSAINANCPWKLIIGLLIFCIIELFILLFQLFTNCKKYSKKEIKYSIEYDLKNNDNQLNDELKKEIENALFNK